MLKLAKVTRSELLNTLGFLYTTMPPGCSVQFKNRLEALIVRVDRAGLEEGDGESLPAIDAAESRDADYEAKYRGTKFDPPGRPTEAKPAIGTADALVEGRRDPGKVELTVQAGDDVPIEQLELQIWHAVEALRRCLPGARLSRRMP